MSKLSRRPGRRDRKARAPIRPQHHMRRLIVLIEARNRAMAKLEEAKADAVSEKDAAIAFEQAQEAQQRYLAYRSRGHGRQRFEPQHNRQARRSKYKPHQGKQEQARRVRQEDVLYARKYQVLA